ncbi:HAMP domain-containing sensor histidine kinase [Haemophilus parahaemolyticus]|uniref:HAMP domain-containing sensor histidine kinase n=1 Tax=Haemophilus parahaemolyticus TaxID=735 RepID=UPI0028E46BDB|nr:HAMP domain-containing sensor histidine kinase [Haemophilus parahaemolyticus]
MRKRNKNFRPKVQQNLIHIKEELEWKIKKANEDNQKKIEAINNSHNLHIAYLSNFMSHDIKNSIQNIDAILSSNSANEITDEHLDILRKQVVLIRETISNFSHLVPHSRSGSFKLNSLIGAIESLNKHILEENNIQFKKNILDDIDLYLKFPFHSLLQMFTNMILNACTNLIGVPNPKILFDIKIDQDKKILYFSLYDNGSDIPDSEKDNIFNYGYSTTGGTGIGLYHVSYLCNIFKGSVSVNKSKDNDYTKYFLIELPFINIEGENNE